MKKISVKLIVLLCICISLWCLFLFGCGRNKKSVEVLDVTTFSLPDSPEEAEINIEPIPNICDDFIRGMDASSVLVLENSGVTFYNYEGEEQDVFMTLAQSGVNYIRLRVWNDPYNEDGNGYGGGNNDVPTAIELGKRATQYGMKVCIDFHYSDFWADPKRQHAPKAWKGMSVEEKCDALYDFTIESLTEILDSGVNVGMVQIGNEINYGMSGETSIPAVMKLLESGSRAVRKISKKYGEDIQIAVHYTNIRNNKEIDNIASNLSEYEIDYDIFAISYYPMWDGTIENMQNVAKNIQKNYGKDVVIAETSYCYTSEDGDGCGNSFIGTYDLVEGYDATVQGQASMIRDICAAANEASILGIFYWEGTWIPVGEATEDNSPIWEKYGSGWASSYAAEYDPTEAGLLYGGCAWENQAMFDFYGYPLPSLNVFKYLKYGSYISSANEDTESIEDDVTDTSQVEGEMTNLVKNPSFEDEDTSMWEITYAGEHNPTDYQLNPNDAYTGDVAFHFWSESDMEFSIEQEIADLEPGTYQLSVYAQGGDMSEDSVLELYAITNGEEEKVPFMLTSYADWQNPTISEIKVIDSTLTIGVRMKCNAYSWGTVDDFKLYRISD